MLAVFFRGLWFVIFSVLAVDSYTILKKNEFDFLRLVSGSIYVLSMIATMYTSTFFANWFWAPRWACWFVLWCVYIRDAFWFITGFSSGCLSYTTFVNHRCITLFRVDLWLLG